jgi:cobalt/nickel transport system permease protein
MGLRSGSSLHRSALFAVVSRREVTWCAIVVGLACLLVPRPAWAMHLSDGVLPGSWCVVWTVAALPFVVVALRRFEKRRAEDDSALPLAAMVGAAVFALSCMPVPVPLVGTCSHPCGTGLAAVLVGPSLAVLLAFVALVLQALFLAHGGVTTLGANVISMGVAGAFAGYAAFRGARRAGAGVWGAGFLAGLASDWATYGTTALVMALALHGDRSFVGVWGAVSAAFAPTQIPIGIFEGVIAGGALSFIAGRRPDLLARLGILPAEAA